MCDTDVLVYFETYPNLPQAGRHRQVSARIRRNWQKTACHDCWGHARLSWQGWKRFGGSVCHPGNTNTAWPTYRLERSYGYETKPLSGACCENLKTKCSCQLWKSWRGELAYVQSVLCGQGMCMQVSCSRFCSVLMHLAWCLKAISRFSYLLQRWWNCRPTHPTARKLQF